MYIRTSLVCSTLRVSSSNPIFNKLQPTGLQFRSVSVFFHINNRCHMETDRTQWSTSICLILQHMKIWSGKMWIPWGVFDHFNIVSLFIDQRWDLSDRFWYNLLQKAWANFVLQLSTFSWEDSFPAMTIFNFFQILICNGKAGLFSYLGGSFSFSFVE